MAERNWTACFLCQKEKLSFPSKNKNFTDDKLQECFREQIDILIKFSDNELMPDDVVCNDMVNLGVTKAINKMIAN